MMRIFESRKKYVMYPLWTRCWQSVEYDNEKGGENKRNISQKTRWRMFSCYRRHLETRGWYRCRTAVTPAVNELLTPSLLHIPLLFLQSLDPFFLSRPLRADEAVGQAREHARVQLKPIVYSLKAFPSHQSHTPFFRWSFYNSSSGSVCFDFFTILEKKGQMLILKDRESNGSQQKQYAQKG